MLLKTQEFLKDHTIDQLKEKYNLHLNYHVDYPNLVQLTYDQLKTPKNELTNECRGLILDMTNPNDPKVVCYPFYRFGDYNPKTNKVDFNDCVFYDKIDGSIISLYFYDNNWHCATKSLPDAHGKIFDYDCTFNEMFWKVWNKLNYELPTETHKNYVFELKFPNRSNLVQTDKESITLLTVRNRNNFQEYHLNETNIYNWKVVESKKSTIEEIQTELRFVDPIYHEGYVACDSKFNRCKIKSPQYEAINLLKSNPEPENQFKQDQINKDNFRRLCDIIRTNDHSSFLKLDKYKTCETQYRLLKKKYNKLVSDLNRFLDSIIGKSGKELGLFLKDKPAFYNGLAFQFSQHKFEDVKDYLFAIDIKTFEQFINSVKL